jgi:hypothetical protein
MRIIFTSVFFALACMASSFQLNAQAFSESTKELNAGLGFGNSYYGYSYVTGANYTQIPTIFLSYDQGTKIELGPGKIGIGGFLGFSSAKASYAYDNYEWSYSWKNTVIGGRGTYHYPVANEKLDLYGGVSIGIWMQSYTYRDTDPFWGGSLNQNQKYSNLYYAGCVGARYLFTDKIGAFGELGWDIALLKLGVTVKL